MYSGKQLAVKSGTYKQCAFLDNVYNNVSGYISLYVNK